MLSKSSHSFTPSPYGYSPCLGESADDYVECIHCLSLWLLAQAAAFGQRPKGSVKPTALSLTPPLFIEGVPVGWGRYKRSA